MQFKIDIQSNNAGWQVHILDATTGRQILPDPRQLRRLGDGLQAVPLPPQEELVGAPAGLPPHCQLCHALCTTSNVTDVIDIYAKIISRAPGRWDMEGFGCYLFTTLLGKDTWQNIQTIAGNRPLELALTWQSSEQAINRLPWEMMHGPERFLAEMPGIAITRRVAGTAHVPGVITSQPRVLFVIGTDIGNDVIRPGAEYLGLLRMLQQTGLGLKIHLLLQASTEKLAAAMKWFQPTIVHFICHGVFDGETSYLELMDNEQPNSAEPVPAWATNLLQALRPEPNMPLPSVVILSACSTANTELVPQEAGQIASPLAVELVRGGIPIVVGMAGEVSDQACRLFSRRFFEALLQNGDISHAVAEGRRGGIISNSGSDPRTSVDWALPTLFLSEGLEESRLRIELPQPVQDLHAIAEEYASIAYPAFCDRLELLQWCDLLMADATTQAKISPERRALQVLAIAVDTPPGSKHQYGRTRLLREMAAHAVRNGHVPCLLTNKEVTEEEYWPKTLQDLLTAIKISANLVTAPRFGVDPPPDWKYIPLLLKQKQGEALPNCVPEELKMVYSNVNQNPEHPMLVARAFRLDLLLFLDIIRKTLPEQERDKAKLLLLIDDVHKMGEAAGDLLKHLFSYGLRVSSAQNNIRVVFTYSAVAEVGQGPAVEEIKTWIELSNWAQPLTLTAFREPLEARLAYQQFLLNWREENRLDGQRMALTPINLGKDKEFFIKFFFGRLHIATQRGVPKYLTSQEVLDEIKEYQNLTRSTLGYELLRRANDDDVLRTL